jgi:hypothetical protein
MLPGRRDTPRAVASPPCRSRVSCARPVSRGPAVISAVTASAPSISRHANDASPLLAAAVTSTSHVRMKSCAAGSRARLRGRPS